MSVKNFGVLKFSFYKCKSRQVPYKAFIRTFKMLLSKVLVSYEIT